MTLKSCVTKQINRFNWGVHSQSNVPKPLTFKDILCSSVKYFNHENVLNSMQFFLNMSNLNELTMHWKPCSFLRDKKKFGPS